jgi:hypothetical protein
MRRMRNVKTGKIITVVEYIMLKDSCWEYYVTDKIDKGGDGVEILAYGDDVEHTIVSLAEIKSKVGYRTRDLKQLQAVPGWRWIKKD